MLSSTRVRVAAYRPMPKTTATWYAIRLNDRSFVLVGRRIVDP